MVDDASLVAWLHGRSIAVIRRRRSGRLDLTYDEHVVEALGTGAVCLSAALPVRGRRWEGDRCEYWLEGLLPEGETRTILEQQFHVRRGDVFALLAAIGRDCAGAVCFLPDGEVPAQPSPPGALAEADVAALIADLPGHPLGADRYVRVSLGGLQSKLLLVRTAHGWARPGPGTPSTHILKPDPPGMSGLIASEALVLKAAARSGVPAAVAQVLDVDGRAVLAVERYDRRWTEDAIHRIHQEDGCQALGLDPSGPRKYEGTSGTPSFRHFAELLAQHAHDPVAEWRRLGAAMTVSVAVGNTDGHARNYSFVIEHGALSLAPAYDVAPTIHFAATDQLGLRVGGQALLPYITRGHLIREMSNWGLPGREARRVVSDILDRLVVNLPHAAGEVPNVNPELLADCVQRVRSLAATPDD